VFEAGYVELEFLMLLEVVVRVPMLPEIRALIFFLLVLLTVQAALGFFQSGESPYFKVYLKGVSKPHAAS
jgi:hypothetical protein